MPDSSDSPLLADDRSGEAPSRSTTPTELPGRTLCLVVGTLFFGATLASVDVAYNIATYTYVGSDFYQVEHASWLLVAHELVHSMVQPIFGSLSNLYGLKRLTLVAYSLFAVGSILCGLSAGFVQVILGRVITSIGVSGIAVLVTFTLSDMVSIRTFAILQSFHSICETIGLVVGGLLGASMATASGWRLLYRINAFLGVFPALGLLLFMRDAATPLSPVDSERASHHSSYRRLAKFDFVGATSLAIAVSSIIFALELGERNGKWPLVVMLCAISIFAATFFFLAESRRPEKALLPLRLLKVPVIRFSIMCNSIIMFGYTMSLYQVSFYLQVHEYGDHDAKSVGLVPLYVGLGVGFLIGGLYVRATGNARTVVASSAGCATACYAFLASGYVDIGLGWNMLLLFFLGASLATSFEGLIVALISRSDKKDNTLLIGMNSVLVSIFGTLGTKASATLLHRVAISTAKSKFEDPGFAKEVMTRVFKSLEELQSLSPETRAVVIESIRESYQSLHVYVCGVSFVAAIIALGLKAMV